MKMLAKKGYYLPVLLAAVLLAILTSGCSREGKKVKLEMKFVEGRELVYDVVSERTITINSNDSVSQTSKSHGEMILRVEELKPDGSARIKETSFWSWTEMDSDSVVEVVSKSESLIYTMNANGAITGLEIASDKDASKWKEYAESNLEQSQPTFPSKPVGLSYDWMQTVKIFLPEGEKYDASTTYEIADFIEVDQRKLVVINYSGNLVLPFDVIESDSLTRTGIDKIDVTGTIWFDYENGYVFSQHENTKMTAERAKIMPTSATRYTAYIEGDVYYHLTLE